MTLFTVNRSTWLGFILVGLVAGAPIVLTQRISGPAAGPSVALKAPDAPADQLVGSDACRSCHRPEFVQYNKTSHSKLATGSSSVMNCESCHGPGKAHVEGQQAAAGDEAKTLAANKLIYAFRGNAKESAQRCLSCHETSKQQDSYLHSVHISGALSCNSCHSIW
jgi:hypothetical protein